MFVFEQSVVAGVVTGIAVGLEPYRRDGLGPEAAGLAWPVAAAAGPPLAVAVGECDAMYTGGGVGSHCLWLHLSDRRACLLHSDFVAS